MVTLTEISTSAIARVLERKFLTDREFCKETKLDSGRLCATRENKRADDRSLFERFHPSWVGRDVRMVDWSCCQEIYRFPSSNNPSGYSFQNNKSQIRGVL